MLLAIHASSLALAIPATLLLLGLLILICARLLRSQPFLYWCAAGHVLPGLALALQATLSPEQQVFLSAPIALLYLGGVAAIAHGMMIRFGGTLSLGTVVLLSSQAMIGILVCSWLIDDLGARMVMLNCAILALYLITVPQMMRHWQRQHKWDRTISVTYALRGTFALARGLFVIYCAATIGDVSHLLSPLHFQIAMSMVMLYSVWFSFCVILAGVRDEMTRLSDERDRDPLTGHYNRRGFFERAHATIKADPIGPWYLISCDIDHFKRINDTYGHASGDAVLRHIGATLKQQSDGPCDTVARFGGEEFNLLRRFEDDNAAYLGTERMRQSLSSDIVAPMDYPVQASFGLTRVQHASDLDHALRRADALLYEAKRSGRNQVVPDPMLILSPHLGASSRGRIVPLIAPKGARAARNGRVA